MKVDDVFVRQGYGKRLGFGTSPALLIIDFQNAWKDVNIVGSAEMAEAMAQTRDVLDAARKSRLPVFYTRHMYFKDGSDHGVLIRKIPTLAVLTEDHPASQIVEELAPGPGDIIIKKRYPSAFFCTDFASLLHLRRVDTLIITGCSTATCVQASACDAMGHGFVPIIVRECVGDRHALSHDAALINIDMKYGDVVERSEVLSYLKKVKV